MYSSSEFARLMGISLDTLRYYEKERLISPRINVNGRRIYEKHDVKWMEFILRLKDTGMSIKDIYEYSELRAVGASTLQPRMDLLKKHRDIIEKKIFMLQDNLKKLDEKIEYYKEELSFRKS